MQPIVLVVVTEDEARHAIAGAVEDVGCDVTTLASVEGAAALLARPTERWPDLLVLDERGTRSGAAGGADHETGAAALLQQFKAGGQAPVLLVASGHASEPIMLADEIIVRPMTADALAAAVARVVPGLLRTTR